MGDVVSSRRIDVEGCGVRLAADVAGDPADPAVLLFHGGGQTRHSWRFTLETLAADGWYAMSVDLRGHGDSEWPEDADYTLDAFAGDVLAVAERFDRPALVGASLGGTAALAALGRRDAEPVGRALVLVDVAPRIESSGSNRIREFMRAHAESGFGSLEEVAAAIQAYNPHRPPPDDLSGLQKNVRRREDGRYYWHWDPRFLSDRSPGEPSTLIRVDRLEDAARALTVPTLLVRGRQSDLLSEAGAAAFLELVPHAQYADVGGAGHMVAGDRNDAFNEAVTSFLRTVR